MAKEAPFDHIILTGAPKALPEPLLDQLASGGRLIAPLGGGGQKLMIVDKTATAALHVHSVGTVGLVPMVPQ